jgi:hypothetical protein
MTGANALHVDSGMRDSVPLLLTKEQVKLVLHTDDAFLNELIGTGAVAAIAICRQVRFDADEVFTIQRTLLANNDEEPGAIHANYENGRGSPAFN